MMMVGLQVRQAVHVEALVGTVFRVGEPTGPRAVDLYLSKVRWGLLPVSEACDAATGGELAPGVVAGDGG